MADLTVKEVKVKRTEFEAALIKLVRDFEKETGAYVKYFSVDRENDDVDRGCCHKSEDRGKVTNISADIDILDMLKIS